MNKHYKRLTYYFLQLIDIQHLRSCSQQINYITKFIINNINVRNALSDSKSISRNESKTLAITVYKS